MDAGECHLHNQFLLFVLNLKYRLLQNHRMFKLEKTLEIVSFTLLYYMAAYYPQLTGLSRQEYWSGLLFPSPGDLPDPVIEPGFTVLQADSLPSVRIKNLRAVKHKR